MQTIHIDVDESKMDVLLNIIKNLKEDVAKNYTISNSDDAYYDARKQRLTVLREDIQSGKESMSDFSSVEDNNVL